MTFQIIAIDTIHSGYGIDLATTDNVIVSKGRSLISTDGIGINGTGGHLASIYGNLTAAQDGVHLAASAYSHIFVGRDGSINAGQRGVFADGDNTKLINYGEITSAGAAAIAFSLSIMPTSGPPSGFVIRNFGSISGEQAITVSDAKVNIYNAGTISSFLNTAIKIGSGDDFMRNYGKIVGDIEFGDGVNQLYNRGTIEGSVYFGAFSDHFDNRGGILFVLANLGDGNDTFIPGASKELVYGGAGRDNLDLRFGGAAIIALDQSFASGGATLGDQYSQFENVFGSSGSDIIVGDASDNTLYGFVGNDQLSGGVGQDQLYGDVGNDVLTGGSGNDLLGGGVGVDILDGGAGSDELYGGLGADKFVFDQTALAANVASAMDTIYDFSHDEKDRIDLSLIDANTLVAGNNAFAFIGTAAFGSHAGELRYNTADSTIQADTNGDGIADFVIKVVVGIPLLAADFIL